ncbi:MAG: hypothetical protein HYV32_01690 [Candidatus Kerfeldbacteria bacterium]|nr:hypothetical protein [Candidatus Kerfeldbacteria bacterium]
MPKNRIRGRGGEPFAKKPWPGWKNLATEKWNPAVRAHYAERITNRRVERCRLAEGIISLNQDGESIGINAEHGVNFMEDIIPRIIERVRQENDHRPVRILDMGCGFGFFTDQIRKKFGKDVVVFGTSIENLVQPEVATKQKRAIVNAVCKKELSLPPGSTEQLNDTIHPNDRKLRSILEMRDFEEFDLIIDTNGEFLYSGQGDIYATNLPYFSDVLRAAIAKLLPGGELYVAAVHARDFGKIQHMKKELPTGAPIEIDIGNRGKYGTAFVIKKKTA